MMYKSRLSERDRAIIRNIERFRVMDRDSIAELHFEGLRNPKGSANNVLLRLLRDGHIERSTAYMPYVYFAPNARIKHHSAKIRHFLAILDAYKDIRSHGDIQTFLVEPKYGAKGTVEPDAFLRFRNTDFFIEVQRTIYSENQMRDKLRRYVDLASGGTIGDPFPHVLIISDHRYALDGIYPFKLFQAQSFSAFMNRLKGVNKSAEISSNSGIKIKIG